MQLIKRTEEYRVETEEEAIALIQKFKDNQARDGYEVTKSGYSMKTKKSKGEIISMWFVCNITMNFNLGE